MEVAVIQNKIYEIRGQRVMLDFDLAVMYQVETKALKQAVRRNIERFPSDFMFEISNEEYNSLKYSLRSQIVTSNKGGIRYMPFAFTELCQPLHNSVYVNKKIMQSLPLNKLIYNINTGIFLYIIFLFLFKSA